MHPNQPRNPRTQAFEPLGPRRLTGKVTVRVDPAVSDALSAIPVAERGDLLRTAIASAVAAYFQREREADDSDAPT